MLASSLMMATAKADEPMELVFDTSLGDLTIELPLNGTVDATVDWGDGLFDNYTTEGTQTHTYSTGRIYTVRVSGTVTQFGSGLTQLTRPELTKCLSFGDIGTTSLHGAFRDCSNLIEVPDTLPDAVTTLLRMFLNASSFNYNIGLWDTSNITNMAVMFNGASSFNQNINSWNTSNVAFMGNMFTNCVSMTFPLGDWQTNLSTQPVNFSANANATFIAYRGTTNFPLLADTVTRINT
jgi:surface protein